MFWGGISCEYLVDVLSLRFAIKTAVFFRFDNQGVAKRLMLVCNIGCVRRQNGA